MNSGPISAAVEVQRKIRAIQAFTIAWMTIEAALSLRAAFTAHSPALLGFGGDSLIELLSAAVVYWRFRDRPAVSRAEGQATRIAGGLLFALAAFVLIASGVTLLGYSQPQLSVLGMALLIAAAVVMPWLARQKRKLSVVAGSSALRADAAESAICGYLAWIALAGLGVNAVWKLKWADPVAALLLIPIILREGWEAIQGHTCENC